MRKNICSTIQYYILIKNHIISSKVIAGYTYQLSKKCTDKVMICAIMHIQEWNINFSLWKHNASKKINFPQRKRNTSKINTINTIQFCKNCEFCYEYIIQDSFAIHTLYMDIWHS